MDYKEDAGMGDKLSSKQVERVQVMGTPITVSEVVSPSLLDDQEFEQLIASAAQAARARGDTLLADLLEAEVEE